MYSCIAALVTVVTILVSMLRPISQDGLVLPSGLPGAVPTSTPSPVFTLSFPDEPIFSPLASHLANDPYPWRNKQPIRDANFALLTGAVEGYIDSGAWEYDLLYGDTNTTTEVIPPMNETEGSSNRTGASWCERAEQWLIDLVDGLAVSDSMVEQHTPDPWAFPLGALYLFLLLSILVLHCYVGSSDTAEEEAGARGQATAEEGTGRRGVRFDDVPEIIEVPALDVESTTMDEVLSLLGEIQEDMAGLAGRIDRLSSKMGSHIEHLADRISDADNRSRVLPLLDWEEERFNSFWVVLEDHVQESFQEQLARVSEVAEVIQRAGQDLLQPDEYEALTRNLCDEIDYSLGVVTKLRQRVASEASSS